MIFLILFLIWNNVNHSSSKVYSWTWVPCISIPEWNTAVEILLSPLPLWNDVNLLAGQQILVIDMLTVFSHMSMLSCSWHIFLPKQCFCCTGLFSQRHVLKSLRLTEQCMFRDSCFRSFSAYDFVRLLHFTSTTKLWRYMCAKIQSSVIEIKLLKWGMHQSEAKWQRADLDEEVFGK